MKTIIINIFGGPCSGKTNAAWKIASKLKENGYEVEYVAEIAKEYVWDNKWDLLDGSLKHQKQLFTEQNHLIQRLVGKVEFVVTDSPTLLSLVYIKEFNKRFRKTVLNSFCNQNSYNIFLMRSENDNTFKQKGRIHNLEQSKNIDKEIIKILDRYCIEYNKYTHGQISDFDLQKYITD